MIVPRSARFTGPHRNRTESTWVTIGGFSATRRKDPKGVQR